jgi:hypothetical protein
MVAGFSTDIITGVWAAAIDTNAGRQQSRRRHTEDFTAINSLSSVYQASGRVSLPDVFLLINPEAVDFEAERNLAERNLVPEGSPPAVPGACRCLTYSL